MANNGNLIDNSKRTPKEVRENASKGGKASGKARREKKAIKEGILAIMNEQAPDGVKKAYRKNGYDVETNTDAVVAAILTGAIKGNPKMVDRVLEVLGEDAKTEARKAEVAIQKERLKIEQEKAELDKERATLENERQKLWLEAVKAQQGQGEELPDDGFLDALNGSALEDWNNESV